MYAWEMSLGERGHSSICDVWFLTREAKFVSSLFRAFRLAKRKVKSMSSNNFDQLTKALASSTSRRQTLKTILAGAGSLFALGNLGSALARKGCEPNGSACVQNRDCCSHDCFRGTCTCKPRGVACSFGLECCSGHCSGVCA